MCEGGRPEVRSASLENSKGGSVARPVSQLACLSCCSILTERASGGCAVGGRLLSTPSRLFLHTGQVSCCDREREKNEVYQPNTVVHFFCKRFLCCRDSPRFQDEWCTVKTSVTNLREQFKPISPLTTSTPRPYQLQPRHYTVTVEVMEAG